MFVLTHVEQSNCQSKAAHSHNKKTFTMLINNHIQSCLTSRLVADQFTSYFRPESDALVLYCVDQLYCCVKDNSAVLQPLFPSKGMLFQYRHVSAVEI